MKNMMSQVKNCNPSSLRPLVLCTLSLCTLLCSLFLTGCKDKGPDTFAGKQSRPVWTAATDYDMSASMTAVVKVDLNTQYPVLAKDFAVEDQDLLAAFADGQCIGVAEPQEGLFFLYITGTDKPVTLRYYSAHYANLFETKDTFEFANDTQLGTVSEPFTPTWTVAK